MPHSAGGASPGVEIQESIFTANSAERTLCMAFSRSAPSMIDACRTTSSLKAKSLCRRLAVCLNRRRVIFITRSDWKRGRPCSPVLTSLWSDEGCNHNLGYGRNSRKRAPAKGLRWGRKQIIQRWSRPADSKGSR